MAFKDFFLGKKKNDMIKGNDTQAVNELNKYTYTATSAQPAAPVRPVAPVRPAVPRQPQAQYRVERVEMTGITEYTYLHGDQTIGSAAALVAPGFPVEVHGCGLRLVSPFDSTIFPGCFREINDLNTRTAYARITYYGEGSHSLRCPQGEFVVRSHHQGWDFLSNGTSIASLSRMDPCTNHMHMRVRENLPDSLALLMLTFPLFCIGM